MSTRNSHKRRGRSSSPFVMLHWHLLDSRGWHQLSPYARLAYIELARLYNGKNNGHISLSARQLARLMPCDKATASRALRELEDAGFIETVKVGTFTRKNHLASEYRLCIYTCDVTGELPKRNWNCLRWNLCDGTIRSYRTGAQTRHNEAKTLSRVRPDRTVSLESDRSTVREDRTHLESAMGGWPNGHALRIIARTRDREAENQTPGAAASLPVPFKTNSGTEVPKPRRKISQLVEPQVEEQAFPELPDFLRRVGPRTSCASAPAGKEKSK